MRRTKVSVLVLPFLLPLAAGASSGKREELAARVRIRAEVVDASTASGSSETRIFSGFSPDGKLRGDWSSHLVSAPFKLRHEWTIDDSGALHVRFEEFTEEVQDSRTGTLRAFKNPVHSEERDLGDAASPAPVTYAIQGLPGKKVAIRFTPEIRSEPIAEPAPGRKIASRGITLYDSEGVVWANDVDADGAYVAFITHRGTLILSFRPFRGSEPSGVAEGRKITLRMKDYPRITLQGLDEFVPPATRARVHVRYVKAKRTGGLNSVTVLESAEEKKLLSRFE